MTAKVAMFQDAFSKAPRTTDLAKVLEAIRNGKYADQIRRARELFAAWKAVCPALDSKLSPEAKAYDAFKKTLPGFCISGTASDRKAPLVHSGLIQVDCDKLNGTLPSLRERVKADPHVAFGFISPSGDGLKLGLRIDGARHLESFQAATIYFKDTYGVDVDPAVKDRLRLCFVSSDPDAWINEAAEPLPISEAPTVAAAGLNAEHTSQSLDASTAEPSVLVLPSGAVSISESARAFFSRIAPSRTLFWRGGALVELVDTGEGVAGLDILKPDAFRSRAERFGFLMAWRSGSKGQPPVLKPAKMSKDDASAILAAAEAREFLPPVASVLRCAVLIECNKHEVAVLGRGYHVEAGGLLIVAGDPPPPVPLPEAVERLKWLVSEFDFQTEGDRSRALAAFVTPALRIGGHLRGNIPVDVAEADQSQSGKGYRHTLVCELYGEASYFVTARTGGVGSVDESFAAALIAGRPFICLDNFRGRLDSQHLEAFLTCPALFPARIPHRGEVAIDPKRFLLQMSSNGLEATRDLVNRASICRIRKRPGFLYRDTLGELRSHQPEFLGSVFAVLAHWIQAGKPRTADTRHDFREWCQTLDWIVQNVFGCAPLMDGHEDAQQRCSNPALSWLRKVAVAVEGERRLGESLIASEVVELCELHNIDIPGDPKAEDEAKRQAGRLFRRVFKEADAVAVDGYNVRRGRKEYRKPSGDLDFTPDYTFSK